MNLQRSDRAEIGRRVKERREELGLRQEDLVTRSGVSRSTISHIESGDRFPSWPNSIKLGAALDIDPAELADVASPSMLYLVTAIAEKLGIPLRPGSVADAEARADQATDHVRDRVEKMTSDQPRSAEGGSPS